MLNEQATTTLRSQRSTTPLGTQVHQAADLRRRRPARPRRPPPAASPGRPPTLGPRPDHSGQPPARHDARLTSPQPSRRPGGTSRAREPRQPDATAGPKGSAGPRKRPAATASAHPAKITNDRGYDATNDKQYDGEQKKPQAPTASFRVIVATGPLVHHSMAVEFLPMLMRLPVVQVGYPPSPSGQLPEFLSKITIPCVAASRPDGAGAVRRSGAPCEVRCQTLYLRRHNR